MIGERFGRLVVIAPSSRGRSYWLCLCDCGNEKAIRKDHLKTGRVVSCSCRMREVAAASNLRHGLTNTKIHHIWTSMLQRCTNSKNQFFHRYGARGISVCERWMTFENFLADMGHPPAGLTLDRVNNDGNYEPGNCRWATQKMQARNSTNAKLITHAGRTLSVSEWAEVTGLPRSCLYGRFENGWDTARALSQPLRTTGVSA